ncbi:MAG TPA: alpha/beta fold hydrolase [Gammaproteobacteria bacterium]
MRDMNEVSPPPARRPAMPPPSTNVGPGPAVVVVHGLWMPGWETWLLRRRLEAAGYRTYVFVYRTVEHGLDENANRLAEFAAGIPGAPLHFVGHSLGGVLILRLFQRHALPHAGRIVCLGSPLNGTHAGRVLEGTPFGRRVVGRCIRDLLTSGGCGAWTGPCEVGVIAGSLPLGLGRLLGGLPSPNDGTVAVDETRLAGAADHVVLPCTHLSMLWSPEVAEHVVRFLRAGRFTEPKPRG